MTRLTLAKGKTPTHCSGYTNKKKKARARNALSSVPPTLSNRRKRHVKRTLSHRTRHNSREHTHAETETKDNDQKMRPAGGKRVSCRASSPGLTPRTHGAHSPPRVGLARQGGATEGKTVLIIIIIRHDTKDDKARREARGRRGSHTGDSARAQHTHTSVRSHTRLHALAFSPGFTHSCRGRCHRRPLRFSSSSRAQNQRTQSRSWNPAVSWLWSRVSPSGRAAA